MDHVELGQREVSLTEDNRPWPVDLARTPEFHLGGVRVRPGRRQLVGASGESFILEPRVAQVLVALARANGEILTRDDLVERCWDGRIVGEDAIQRVIAQLRRSAANFRNPPFTIETITKVGYRLQAAITPAAPEPAGATPPPPPNVTSETPAQTSDSRIRSTKPTIAVMPFANLSVDPEQAYFAEGIVAEIVAKLAGFKVLSVIPAGAGLTMAGQALSPHQAAREMGVTYLLEGNVRRAANRVRIGLHLVDATSGASIWSDRLEDDMADIFALQDRVAQRVAGVIFGTVEDADGQKASLRPTSNLNSYDLYLRALWLFGFSRKAEMLEAIDLLENAIALDPQFAVALSQCAISLRQVVDHRWVDDMERYRRRGLEVAEQALRFGYDDATILSRVAGSLPGLENRFDRAFALLDRAISLNPNSAFVWLISGSVRVRAGHADIAAEHLQYGMRLDPISSYNAYMRMYLAAARFQQGRFEETLALFNATTLRLPVSYVILAAVHAYLGNMAEARTSLASFGEAFGGRVEDAVKLWFARPETAELLLEGIRRLETSEPAQAIGST